MADKSPEAQPRPTVLTSEHFDETFARVEASPRLNELFHEDLELTSDKDCIDSRHREWDDVGQIRTRVFGSEACRLGFPGVKSRADRCGSLAVAVGARPLIEKGVRAYHLGSLVATGTGARPKLRSPQRDPSSRRLLIP
jgi:hypothetical protein